MASLLWTVLLICVAAPYALEAAALGEACTDTIDCDTPDPTKTVCDNKLCKLKAGGVCTTADEANCPTGSTCPTDTVCTCTPPLVADPATGLCKPDSSGGSQQQNPPAAGALGGACRPSGVACDPAATSVCDTDDNKCKLKAGEDCSSDASHCPTVAPCDTTSQPKTCTCAAGTVADSATGLCKQDSSVVVQPQNPPAAGALGGACLTGGTCTDATSVCDTDKCKLKADGDCSGANTDKCQTGSTCVQNKCKCPASKVADKTTGLCTVNKVGATCANDADCPAASHLKCDTGDTKKCICADGYSGADCNSGSAALTSVTSLALVTLFWASRHLLKE